MIGIWLIVNYFFIDIQYDYTPVNKFIKLYKYNLIQISYILNIIHRTNRSDCL